MFAVSPFTAEDWPVFRRRKQDKSEMMIKVPFMAFHLHSCGIFQLWSFLAPWVFPNSVKNQHLPHRCLSRPRWTNSSSSKAWRICLMAWGPRSARSQESVIVIYEIWWFNGIPWDLMGCNE